MATPASQDPETSRPTRWLLLARRLPAFWPALFLVWMAGPVVDGLRSGTIKGAVIAGALLAVSGLYFYSAVVVFSRRLRSWTGVLGPLLAMVALTALLAGIGAPADVVGTCLPYLAVVAVLTLPMWAAVPICLIAAALAAWGPGHDPSLGSTVLISGVGSAFGVFGRRRGLEAQAAREATARLQVQEERNRMARDVHDILGHSLTVITVKAQLAGRLVDLDPARAKAELADLEQLSRSALADVRHTVSQFREISLAGELAGARQALQAAGIRAEIPTAVTEVEPDLRELFAWVVREGTTNVIRHSGARTCTITLTPTSIDLRDDGRGSAAGAGNGLSGLAERARAAGAVVRSGTRPGGGFGLRVGLADPADSDRDAAATTMTA